ncbi:MULTISPECIES: hypothetical protein [Cytobacillus]|uniref:hypothetical protein n=1 Tax=Cytobacillus TaxID=2675230 RepID=UPI0015879B8A|nr:MULTISPECIES: hypothetical protein [Cytobacillus]
MTIILNENTTKMITEEEFTFLAYEFIRLVDDYIKCQCTETKKFLIQDINLLGEAMDL